MANAQLEYKCERYGKNYIKIGRFQPSSKICTLCGEHNKELKLSQRTWTCKNGHVLDRDINASLNIRDFGLRTKPKNVKVSHWAMLSSNEASTL